MLDYERLRPTERAWDLTGMRRLLQRSGWCPGARPAVQVAGSKGKGTAASWLHALVVGGGGRAGLYSSPHLTTLRERIRVGEQWVPIDELAAILERLLALAGDQPPTFFEAMTAAAVEWFARRRCDVAIYEVGLGGRHDATTAIDVDAAIVTRVELEHTEVLGATIAAIADEKAQVIRPHGLGLTACTGEALRIVREHADRVDAELLVLGEDFALVDGVRASDGLGGTLRLPDGERRRFWLPGAAMFELPAFALAAAALARVAPQWLPPLDPAPRPLLPCRFEVFEEPDGEVLVLDGAHTEDSLRAVADELARRFPGRRPVVLTAAASGKRWREGLSALLPLADDFVVTELTGTPGEPAAAIASWLVDNGARSEVAADASSGLRRLRERPGPRLVVGSFYLAGAVRRLVARPDEDHDR